ncbi:hypothetical protein NKH61_27685 [Mesorhizobium sp. M1005]|uniref:hypothetical protein n=1 Tax=unclassified Mesorhizobium TaxID=325217 RepID=UPI00333A34BD
MTWIAVVRKALQSVSQMDGFEGTRNAVFGLWLALDAAPKLARDMYRGFSESKLQTEAAELEQDQILGTPPAATRTRADKEKLLWWLAVRLRALENLLYDIADGSPVRRASDCRARFGSQSAFILMRDPLHRAAKTGDSFRRRGLRRARVIPTKIDDLEVKLVFADDPRGRTRAARAVPLSSGAGLFKDLKLTFNEVDGGFIVSDAIAPSQLDVIRDQIAMASTADCIGVVYPELTISKPTALEVARCLADGSWKCELSFLVVGSHHEKTDEGWFNVAAIMDGYGNALEPHRKLFQFLDGEGPHEAIEHGTRLPVLVMEQAVVAFGICLDFCNLAEDPPYADLDVDYVVVPSYGGASTMKGHIRRSTELLEKLKSRTIVVQQFYAPKPTPDDPLGYVLARVEPAVPTLADLEKTVPWTVCSL